MARDLACTPLGAFWKELERSRIFWPAILLSVLASVPVTQTPASQPPASHWRGSVDDRFSNPTNWSPVGVPGADARAVFDENSTGNCRVDAPTTLGSLGVEAAFSSELVLDAHLNVVDDVEILAGSLTARGHELRVSGNVTLADAVQMGQDTCRLVLRGARNQNLRLPSAATLDLRIDGDDGAVIFPSGFSLRSGSSFSIRPGADVLFGSSELFQFPSVQWKGNAGAPISIRSTSPGVPFFLDLPTGPNQIVAYVEARDSDATSGAVVNAREGCEDGGGNRHWDFGVTPRLLQALTPLAGRTRVLIRYSAEMDHESATQAGHYQFSDGLAVRSATMSPDGTAVMLELTGDVTPNRTTIRAGADILSLVGNPLAPTTLVIQTAPVASSALGGVQVELSLATDGNQSVIQLMDAAYLDLPDPFLEVPLTVTVDNGDGQTIKIKQVTVGEGVVEFEDMGGTIGSEVTFVAMGPSHQEFIKVRGVTRSIFEKDLKIEARSADEVVLYAEKEVTVIHVGLAADTPRCVVVTDARGATHSLEVQPLIAMPLSFTVTPYVVHGGHASATTEIGGPRKLMAIPQESGSSTMQMESTVCPQTSYTLSTVTADGVDGTAGFAVDTAYEQDDCEDDDCMECPTGSMAFSVDPRRGEKRLDLTDLVITGRGLDYAFQRAYRGLDARSLGSTNLHQDFGANWFCSYVDDYLLKDGMGPDEDANYLRIKPDGTGFVFVNLDTMSWSSPPKHFIQLHAETDGFAIRHRNGLIKRYHGFSDTFLPNKNGRLKAIRDRNENRMSFLYDKIDLDTPDFVTITADASLASKGVSALTFCPDENAFFWARADATNDLRRVTTAGVESSIGNLNHRATGLAVLSPMATDCHLYSVSADDDQLRRLDETNGQQISTVAITLAGETVLSGTGLAKHPTTEALWALLNLQGQSEQELVTLDTSGVATSVGTATADLVGLAFDATAALYGVTGSNAVAPESLLLLSTVDATQQYVLTFGDGDVGEALAFNPLDGRMYHASGGGTSPVVVFESFDPVDLVPDTEKCVLTRVIDSLGREIRYQYYAKTDQSILGTRQVTVATTNSSAWGRLARVLDFKGDMDFDGVAASEDFAGQTNNRTLVFDYDAEGNLVRASRPAITGTPNGNNFPMGKTYRYGYITTADLPAGLSQQQEKLLLHKLTHIWFPNEVRNDVNGSQLITGDAREVLTYIEDPGDRFFSFPETRTVGGTNDTGIDSGGTHTYTWSDLNPDNSVPGGIPQDRTLLYTTDSFEVTVEDPNGNESQYRMGAGMNVLDLKRQTRMFRPTHDPASFDETYVQNADRLDVEVELPAGNLKNKTIDDGAPFQRGNTIGEVFTPHLTNGTNDQDEIASVTVFEPVYNRPCLAVFPRGVDPSFDPPLDEPGMPRTIDYNGQTLDLRYSRVEFFDYQESTELASGAPDSRLDIDGSGGKVNESPLTDPMIDPPAHTVEVWLVQELQLPEDPGGLAELRTRLADNLTRLGLGDLNGDGLAEPAYQGNIIRTVRGSPVLVDGSNQHALEAVLDSSDLIDEATSLGGGGAGEGADGARLQTIVWMYQYNAFGQRTKDISPEGNVTDYFYAPENDPDGDTFLTPAPADGRTLDSATGGYLSLRATDGPRGYFDQESTPNFLTGEFSNNNTDPPNTSILRSFGYDDVGNVTATFNGRLILTGHFVNEQDEVVGTGLALEVPTDPNAPDPSDPLVNAPDIRGSVAQALQAFAYETRTFFDYNGNVVLRQVEDEANTSQVDGFGTGLPMEADTAPGLDAADAPSDGLAFADTLYRYDRLDNRIEQRVEVDDSSSLDTRFRYDRNRNLVMTIHPEGNADGWVYDERDLLYQHIRGTTVRPTEPASAGGAEKGHFAANGETTFEPQGRISATESTFTYHYDLNGNRTHSVDAEPNGGTMTTIGGVGDVTSYTYDGFDRLRTVIDPLGNTSFRNYDPDSNVTREIRSGDAIDDDPGGSSVTLAATEWIHDALSRVIASHRVLFVSDGVNPHRPPTLADGGGMDNLAPYLKDADGDAVMIPGQSAGTTVIGRITTLTEYDRESRPTFTIRDDLDVHRTDYDGAGRAVRTLDSALDTGVSGAPSNPICDPDALSGNEICMAYDDNHNLIERLEIDVMAGVADEEFRTTYLYDSLDRLQTVFDNRGHANDYRYDSRGNLVATADAVGPVTGRTFLRRGCGDTTTSVSLNDFGNVTRSFYDGANRLLQTDVLLTANGEGDGVNIGAELTGAAASDPTVDTGQSEDGRITTSYAYDDNSLLLALRDDDGNTTGYIYDYQDRLAGERKGMNAGFQEMAFTLTGGDGGTFREDRMPMTLADPPVETEGGSTDNGTTIEYTFDRDSNIVTTLDEAQNQIDSTYDALNRRLTLDVTTQATGFVGTVAQTWQYDGLSRLTMCTDDNEPASLDDDVVCTYTFDSLSRKIEESQKIGSLGAKHISCAYDVEAGGSVWGCSSTTYPDDRRTNNVYDALDRLLTREDEGETGNPIGTYEYIGKNRVAVLTYQNDTRLTHFGGAGGTTDVGFDDLRRIVNHAWESFTTEPRGNGTTFLGFEHQDGTGTPAPLYDRANNKRIEFKTHDPSNSEQYKYDSAYRLTSTSSGAQGTDARGFERGTFTDATRTSMAGGIAFAQDWDLDGVGNWSRLDDNTRVETRTHTDFNESDERTVAANIAGLDYDKNGNTTSTGVSTAGGQSFPDGGLRLEWDALNRLRRVYDNNETPAVLADDVVLAEYTYDCGNRRIRKRLPGVNGILDAFGPGNDDVATDYYYDGWRVLEERSPTLTEAPPTLDSVDKQYVYGNYLDEVWALDDRAGGTTTISQLNDGSGTDRHFYHCNTLYHVYGLTDEGGLLVEAYEYDPYGFHSVINDGNDGDSTVNFNANDVRTVGGSSAIGSVHTQTGQRYDSESGLTYFKHRYCSVRLGRLLSRDPARSPDGATPDGIWHDKENLGNGYGFVANSPVRFGDPLGLNGGPIMSGTGKPQLKGCCPKQVEADTRDYATCVRVAQNEVGRRLQIIEDVYDSALEEIAEQEARLKAACEESVDRSHPFYRAIVFACQKKVGTAAGLNQAAAYATYESTRAALALVLSLLKADCASAFPCHE